MHRTTPKPGHSRAADVPRNKDIDDAWDQYEEEQEEEESQPQIDRESESMDDFYRELGEEFGMDPGAPSPAPASDSFGDFVAKEAAKAKADAAPPQELEGPLPVSKSDGLRGKTFSAFTPEVEDEPEVAAGLESAAPDSVEMIKEAMRAASGGNSGRRKHIRQLNYVCKAYKTNDALANCHDINDKVRATLAIINGLMSDKGFCYCSDEQLAIWMHMSVRGAKNLLNDIARKGFIISPWFQRLEY